MLREAGETLISSKKTNSGDGQLLRVPGPGRVWMTARAKSGAPKNAEDMSKKYAATKKDFRLIKIGEMRYPRVSILIKHSL